MTMLSVESKRRAVGQRTPSLSSVGGYFHNNRVGGWALSTDASIARRGRRCGVPDCACVCVSVYVCMCVCVCVCVCVEEQVYNTFNRIVERRSNYAGVKF